MLLATTAGAQTRTTPRPAVSPTAAKLVEATGPIAIIDTSAGRFTCRLYTQQAPVTTANFIALAQGSKNWTDASGAVQHGKPFYDALQVFGMSNGLVSGDRAAMGLGSGGPDLTPEKTGLDFDRGGRLAALTSNGNQSSSGFAITDHPDREWAGRGVVFGQCDEASVELSTKLTHELLSTDNHPERPVILPACESSHPASHCHRTPRPSQARLNFAYLRRPPSPPWSRPDRPSPSRPQWGR
jgi:cyclophilin family peptidyl-prolyl cis-trans isomerase